LPLPNQGNQLSEDLPRLRESFIALDAKAQEADQKTAQNDAAQTAARPVVAAQAEVDAGVNAAKFVTPKTLKTTTFNASQISGGTLDKSLTPDLALSADLEEHDRGVDVHAALVKRITAGDMSPVIGVCWIEPGNCTGLWYNCDEDGQPVTPPKRYFDFHPVYAGMRRVLIDGQVMVEAPPFWIKTLRPESGPFAGKLCKVISPAEREGYRPYPAFVRPDGSVGPAYIGAYQATAEASNMAGSRPGKMPLVNLDFPTMQTRCANRNTGGVEGFRMWDYFHYSAVCLLFLIEHCTTESQLILGRGHVDATAATYTDDPAQPQWRGLVGLHGNVWQMVDGFKLDTSRGIQMWKPDGSRVYAATGKTAPSYNGTASQNVIDCQHGDANGIAMDDFFVPASQGSYEQGTFPDYFWGGNGTAGNVLYVGGIWSNGVGAGLFCATLHDTSSHANTTIGCRLAK
jgi:hypothetical protein